MRIPQTAERIKEAPAQALRAVFAGVGQVLLIGERVRRRGGSDSQDAGVAPETDGASGSAETQAEGASSRAQAKAAPAVEGEAKGTATSQNGHGLAAEPAAPQSASASASEKASASKPAKTAAPKATKATAAKTAATPTEAPAADGAASALPVPNYSELSIASLRARMRGLDVGQVRELLTYERDHEGRENVIAMFERRIAKLEEDGDSGAAKG